MDKMRNIKIISLVVFLMCGLSLQAAKETFKSTFKKEFNVSRDAQLRVSNSFGDVQCYTWENNKVSIEVIVQVNADDQKTADRIFDKISVDISGNERLVEEITKISNLNVRNASFKVMVNVYLPETLNLDISNKFGNIFLGDVKGKTILRQSFGELQASELLNADNEIFVEHGSMQVENINEAQIRIEHSQLGIENAGRLKIEAGFTDIEIKDVKKVVIDAEFGSLEIEDVGTIECVSSGTKINIGYLKESILLECEMGSLNIDQVARNFKEIDISGQHAPISFNVENNSSFSLDIYTSFADIYLPDSFGVMKEKLDIKSYRYKGRIGNDASQSIIKIESEFGTIEIN